MKLLILNICKLLWCEMIQTEFVEVATISEIPSGKMNHTEFNRKEIMIANVIGKFYALSGLQICLINQV